MLLAALAVLSTTTCIGILVALAVARPPTGPGFWRLSLLLALAGLAFGLGLRFLYEPVRLAPPPLPATVAYAVTILAAVAAGVRAPLPDGPSTPSAATTVAAVAGACALLLDPASHAAAGGLDAASILYSVGILSVAPSVGSVLLAMVLAHWYLVEPRLPVGPLRKVLLLFAGTELVKLAHLIGLVVLHWPSWVGGPGGLLRAFALGDALFVALRASLGVLAPLALAWLTWKTVEIRSIQSATGILYAAVVLVLFGNVISIYLTLTTGAPF